MHSSDELPIFRPKLSGRSRPEKAPTMKGGFLKQLSAKTVRKKSAPRSLKGGHRNRGAGPAHVKTGSSFSQRVVVKARIVPMHVAGKRAAALHIQYVERGGVEKDGSAGRLYGDENRFDRDSFLMEKEGEAHQFRFIVSPENAHELDLTDYTRKLARQMEDDLGREIEWAAVNHYNTDNPHVHVIVRGVDGEGNELRISRDYISNGLRNRASELATKELGLRSEIEQQRQVSKEFSLSRFTSLDRDIAAIERDGVVDLAGAASGQDSLFRQRRLSARLQVLESFGLAENRGAQEWAMKDNWKQELKAIGKRGEIYEEMHRAVGGDPSRYRIYDRRQHGKRVEGRIAATGLADEWHDRYYIIVESQNGSSWYVDLDRSADPDLYRKGQIVSVNSEKESWLKKVDHSIAGFAESHDGMYDSRKHLKELPSPVVELSSGGKVEGKAYVEAHERRLERLERFDLASHMPDGSWRIPSNLVEKLQERDATNPVVRRKIEQQSSISLPEQETLRGRAWIDRFTDKADHPEFATHGFGKELGESVRRRALFLQELGIDPLDPARGKKLDQLERHDLAEAIRKRDGGTYRELRDGERLQGMLTDEGVLPGGKHYARIADPRSKEFSLVPWRKDFEQLVSKQVELVRTEGTTMVARQFGIQKGR